MEKIYRTFADTEVVALATKIKCPHCGSEWVEEEFNEPGITYIIDCEDCEETFEMSFTTD